MPDFSEYYTGFLKQAELRNSLRALPVLPTGNKILDFSGNDYLCLSSNPDIINAGCKAAQEFGAGATGSRLLSGNKNIFMELEDRIAKDKKTEAALIFSSGFQANSSVLAALTDPAVLKQKPLVFFDKYNHASLYQGTFISDCELIRFKHNDLDNLSELLIKHQSSDAPKFIIAETVYSMDGDILDVNRISKIAREHKAFLYLDEAHASTVFGNKGMGLADADILHGLEYLIMGTFSKGLGGAGAYIACSETLKNFLINKCTGFIYSTAPSPFSAGAALAAWEQSAGMEKERAQLLQIAQYFRNGLKTLGLNFDNSQSQIIPVIIGSEDSAMDLKKKLLAGGILVSAIRPPTVPPGTSRLRFSLNCSHTSENIDSVLKALKELF